MIRPAAPRRLRVLHVIHDYFPAIGGSELLFQRVAEGLAARGMDVWVFTSTAKSTGDFVRRNHDRLPPGPEELNGVRVRRFEYRRFSRPTRYALTAVSSMWSAHQWIGYGWIKAASVGPHLPRLVREAIRLKPDVVVATAAPFMPLYYAAAAARRLAVPVAIMPCLHPGDAWVLDSPPLFDLLRRADGVLTLTSYETALLQAMGVDAARLHLLGGGVSPASPSCALRGLRERHGIENGTPIVLFCGRMEERKGISTVIDAMASIWPTQPNIALVLAGASTEFSRTRLASQLSRVPADRKPNVIVRYDITEEEKWGWYTECDVLAHPSRVESFGLVYVEAWLCGKPVIGGRTGPQSAVIDHGRDGLLVRPGDVEELAGALRRILSDRSAAEALGAAGRAKVLERYTWDRVIDRASEIYFALANARSGMVR